MLRRPIEIRSQVGLQMKPPLASFITSSCSPPQSPSISTPKHELPPIFEAAEIKKRRDELSRTREEMRRDSPIDHHFAILCKDLGKTIVPMHTRPAQVKSENLAVGKLDRPQCVIGIPAFGQLWMSGILS